jgi:hypothetical protein
MGLDAATSVRWSDIDTIMNNITLRNKRMRIINDSLYIKSRGADPIYAWDGGSEQFVWVRKQDWSRGSPAIRLVEACVIIRTTPQLFTTYRDVAGVVSKKSVPGVKGIPRQHPRAYYSIADLMAISRELPVKKGYDPAGDTEIRNLFAKGFTTYKKTKDGQFVPVWDETIY